MSTRSDFLSQAKIFEDQNKFDLALKEYEQAITLGIGNQAVAYQGRGRAFARLGLLEEAESDCQKALTLDPHLHVAHSVLGYIYIQQAKSELAEKELLAALAIEPNDINSLTNLAIIYTNSGRYQPAAELCEKIIRLQPENISPMFHLVRIHLEQSHFQKAIRQLNKLLIARPMTLGLYQLYSIVLVNATLKSFSQLNIFARVCVLMLFQAVALLTPGLLSIPLGILVSLFVLLVIFENLWFGNYKSKNKEQVFLGIFSLSANSVLYWLFVFLHRMIELALGTPVKFFT